MRTKILVLASFLVCTNFAFGQDKEAKRYATKSGFVKYELSGSTKGTKTLCWDNFGRNYREEVKSTTEIKMFGMSSKEEAHTVTIIIDDKFWSANLIDKTGQKGTLDMQDLGEQIAKELTEAEAEQLQEDLIKALNGKKLGMEKFMGKTCEVIEIMGNKSWIYKGVILKSEVKVMGIEANETAIEFKENIAIDQSKFKPVADIEYQNFDEMKNSMLGM